MIFKILFLHTSTFCVGVFRFQVVRPSTCLRFLFFANWVEAAFFAWQDWATWRAPFETTWVLSHLRRPLCFWKQVGHMLLFSSRKGLSTWVESNEDQDQTNNCPHESTARHLSWFWVCRILAVFLSWVSLRTHLFAAGPMSSLNHYNRGPPDCCQPELTDRFGVLKLGIR